jgi:hypothetical protein
MSDSARASGKCRFCDQQAEASWTYFLSREGRFDCPTSADPLRLDLKSIQSADVYFRDLASGADIAAVGDALRHGRAILDHPLRTAYPLLHRTIDVWGEPTETLKIDYGEVSYGVKSHGEMRCIFVDNQFGIELLSAEIQLDGRLNPWSIRILSLLPHEYLYLDADTVLHLRAVFNSRYFQQASALRENKLADGFPPLLNERMSELAGLPTFLGAIAVNGCGPEGLINRFVPDLAYQACCDGHDICYARGGTEADRQRCDEELARCIEAIGGGALAPGGFTAGFVATLYWIFVAVFGTSAFTYGAVGQGAKAAKKVRKGGGGGGRCSWTVGLRDVTVKGAPSSKLRGEVIPDFEQQLKTNPRAMRQLKLPEVHVEGDQKARFSTDPISVKFGEAQCGSTVRVPILCKATVDDSWLPSTERGSREVTEFVCDGSAYEFTIDVTGFREAAMVVSFNFDVQTRCFAPVAGPG